MKKRLLCMLLVGVMLFTMFGGITQVVYGKATDEKVSSKEKTKSEVLNKKTKIKKSTKHVAETEITLSFSFGKRTGIYTGTLKGGLPDGYGTFSSTSEEGLDWTYYGQWEKGHFSGRGISEWESGDFAMGTFKNDSLNGIGIYSYDNGSEAFVGEIKDGQAVDGVTFLLK